MFWLTNSLNYRKTDHYYFLAAASQVKVVWFLSVVQNTLLFILRLIGAAKSLERSRKHFLDWSVFFKIIMMAPVLKESGLFLLSYDKGRS